MADTGDQRYSKKESLYRILQILKGETITDDRPDVALVPEVLSEDGSLSQIAELMADSLSGATFHLPSAVANDYGEIYAWTGTVALTGYPANVYTKITGTFQNTAYTDGITGQPTLDRMLLSNSGYYFVSWSCSFQGSSAIEYWIEPYRDAVGIPQAVARVKPSSSGSSVNIAGSGIFRSTAASELVDLRMRPNATAWFVPNSVTLTVYRIGEY